MDYLNTLLFGYYPYVAMSVFIIGSIARYDRDQYTWRTGSSQLLAVITRYAADYKYAHRDIGVITEQ